MDVQLLSGHPLLDFAVSLAHLQGVPSARRPRRGEGTFPMTVTVDSDRHEVTLTGDVGSVIVVSWAAALNPGSVLIETGRHDEPIVPEGKASAPTAGERL